MHRNMQYASKNCADKCDVQYGTALGKLVTNTADAFVEYLDTQQVFREKINHFRYLDDVNTYVQ